MVIKRVFFALYFLWLISAAALWASESALEERLQKEERWMHDGLYVLPYRPIYFLPFAFNSNPNNAPFATSQSQELNKTEIKYQISFKVPLVENILSTRDRLFFGYTQACFWQAYNRSISSPFRDTNYEPELFLQFNSQMKLGRFRNRINNFGFAHQSNGREYPLSRSWNRLYADFFLDTKNVVISIKPWLRIPEASADDNNPDIWKYLGYGELRLAMKVRGRHVLSLRLRDNLKLEGNKGAIEAGWSFPLLKSMKGYVQYFNGYGESLIDYNYPVNRISLGFAFNDWL